jgi:hypothetical protein
MPHRGGWHHVEVIPACAPEIEPEEGPTGTAMSRLLAEVERLTAERDTERAVVTELFATPKWFLANRPMAERLTDRMMTAAAQVRADRGES